MNKQRWIVLLLTVSLLLNVALCIWGVHLREELNFAIKQADADFRNWFSELCGHVNNPPREEAGTDEWMLRGEYLAESCWNIISSTSYADDKELADICHELFNRFSLHEGTTEEIVNKELAAKLMKLPTSMHDRALISEIYCALCQN